MKEELNENLKKALDYMFYFIGEACPTNTSYYTKDGWFKKHSWTEKTQERYTEWLSEYLKKNWQGITERKLTSKKDRDKAAEMFVFTYGFKLRPLTIKDFTPLIPEGQLKEIMSKRELEQFNKWAFGSTRSQHGYYRLDVESFLNGLIITDIWKKHSAHFQLYRLMKTIDKLERAGWVFQEYAGRKYLFRRGEEIVLYDLDVDEIVAYNNGVVSKVPDDLDLDIIFEKGV